MATVDKPTHTSQGKSNDKVQYIIFIEITIFPFFVHLQLGSTEREITYSVTSFSHDRGCEVTVQRSTIQRQLGLLTVRNFK